MNYFLPLRPFLLCTLGLAIFGFGCDTANIRNSNNSTLSSDNLSVKSTNYPKSGGNENLIVWANDGTDKVTKDELRAHKDGIARTKNHIWDGVKIILRSARNEVVSFNLVIESPNGPSTDLMLKFNLLTHSSGHKIQSNLASSSPDHGVFTWVDRPIELFLVKYLQIKGLSRLSYETYDERHIPHRLRRPHNFGFGRGGWDSRPDHNKYYPDIALPLEAAGAFSVASKTNQSIWTDIYVPKGSKTGVYSGLIHITKNSTPLASVPVELHVRAFALPDKPTAKTMLFLGYNDLLKRYLGKTFVAPQSNEDSRIKTIRDRHFLVAHRHKISLIDSDPGASPAPVGKPRPEWLKRLSGELFTPENGYDGPGMNVGNGVYSIGTYGSWDWKNKSDEEQQKRASEWASWFRAHSPDTEHFLYIIDESTNYEETEKWAQNTLKANPSLPSLATLSLPQGIKNVPSLSRYASWFTVGDTSEWGEAFNKAKSSPNQRQVYAYNGKRPSNGSFATEDDGVALRQLPWAQYKMGIDRWFFWESTYYNDYQNARGETNVFKVAQTFGAQPVDNAVLGETGGNYSNGDGVLFYPGTDLVYPEDSNGLAGPIVSLRLKHWRRGIQDVDYIALAMKKNPAKTTAIIKRMVPKALWEYGVSNPKDPSWVRSDISWSTNPETWAASLEELALIIEQ